MEGVHGLIDGILYPLRLKLAIKDSILMSSKTSDSPFLERSTDRRFTEFVVFIMSSVTVTQNTAFVLTKASSDNAHSEIMKVTGPIPTPPAHEVLVRIHAVSLNYRDFAIVNGAYPLPVKNNVVLGSDMAGEIVALGEEVSGWKAGDRVTAVCDQTHLYGPAKQSSTLGSDLHPHINSTLLTTCTAAQRKILVAASTGFCSSIESLKPWCSYPFRSI